MRKVVLLASVLLTLAVSGCVGESPTSIDGGGESAEASEESGSPWVGFGETHEYEDGTTISASEPVVRDPHRWVGNVDEGQTSVFTTVTVTAGSGFRPFSYPYASSAGEASEPILTTVESLGVGSARVLRPGQVMSYEIGFSVQDAEDLSVPMAPSTVYPPVVFSNAGELVPLVERYKAGRAECGYWQSDTVIPLEVHFLHPDADLQTGDAGPQRKDLAGFSSEDLAWFKSNVHALAPLAECEARWSSLDFWVESARGEVTAPSPTDPGAGGGAGGSTITTPFPDTDAPDILDCWKIWRPRCW